MKNSSRARRAHRTRMLVAFLGVVFATSLIALAAYAVQWEHEFKKAATAEGAQESLPRVPPDRVQATELLGAIAQTREKWKDVYAAQEMLEHRANGVILAHDLSFLPKQVIIEELLGPLQREDMQLVCKLQHVHTLSVCRTSDESEKRPDFLFDDSSLASLAALPQLKSISFVNTDLTDESFKQLGKITTLEEIEIFQPASRFTGRNFGELGKLRELKSLKIRCYALNMDRLETLRTQLPDCQFEVERTLKVAPSESETVDEAQERLRRAIEGH